MTDPSDVPSPFPRDLLFTVGTPRSGTTWLQHLLSEDPAIVTALETHVFDIYLRSALRGWSVMQTRVSGLDKMMTRQEFVSACRGFSDRILEKVQAAKPDARIVMDKTPDHIHHLPEIREFYPGAKFLMVVRDPRAVVASWRAAGTSWAAWARQPTSYIVQQWVEGNRDARQSVAAAGDGMIVRYEDMLADPVAGLTAILGWLGLQRDPETVARYVEACTPENMRARMTDAFVWKAKADTWRETLSHSDVAVIEDIAGKEMAAFGYDKITSGVPLAKRLRSAILGGFAWRLQRLAKRMKALDRR